MRRSIDARQEFSDPHALGIIEYGQQYLLRRCSSDMAELEQRGHLSEGFADVEPQLEGYVEALRAARRRAGNLEKSPEDTRQMSNEAVLIRAFEDSEDRVQLTSSRCVATYLAQVVNHLESWKGRAKFLQYLVSTVWASTLHSQSAVDRHAFCAAGCAHGQDRPYNK